MSNMCHFHVTAILLHDLDKDSSRSLLINSNESLYMTSYVGLIVTICLRHVLFVLQDFLVNDLHTIPEGHSGS